MTKLQLHLDNLHAPAQGLQIVATKESRQVIDQLSHLVEDKMIAYWSFGGRQNDCVLLNKNFETDVAKKGMQNPYSHKGTRKQNC